MLRSYGCQWDVGCLWRSMDWLRRLDVIVLAFMLVFTLIIVIQVFYRRQILRDSREIDSLGRTKLRAELSVQALRLNSVASIAPYLGMLGACFGIMEAPGMGSGFGMEKGAALRLITSGIAASLITTAAGILVTIPAICSYNYVCTCINWLDIDAPEEAYNSPYKISKRFRLVRRLPQLPAFGAIAGTVMAIIVVLETPHFDPIGPTGLDVNLASTRCENKGGGRLIVLHVTQANQLFLNTEEEDRSNLGGRLSEIYSMREDRTLISLRTWMSPFRPWRMRLTLLKVLEARQEQNL